MPTADFVANSSASVDSELMMHVFAAQSISAVHSFSAVLDEEGDPLLFAISSAGRLLVTRADGQGCATQLDLSADVLAADDTSVVTTFAVDQASDLHLSLVFATQLTRIDPQTNKRTVTSDVHLYTDLSPALLVSQRKQERLQHLKAARDHRHAAWTFHRFYMTRPQPSSAPLIVAAYKGDHEADMARLQVADTEWSWKFDARLYEHADDLRSICAGRHELGSGLFAAYRKDGNVKVMYNTVDPDAYSQWTPLLRVPAEADVRSLATFDDSDGYSGLLLLGDGLWYLSAQMMVDGDEAQLISNHPLLIHAHSLHVAQTGDHVSCWFENDDGVVGLVRLRTSSDATLLTVETAAVPLTCTGSVISYAPVVDSRTKAQRLMLLGKDQALTHMELSPQTDVWSSTPWLLFDAGKGVEVQSYVTRAVIKGLDGRPQARARLLLRSEAATTLLVNGQQLHVGPSDPVPVRTDNQGVLTVVAPTNDLVAYQLRIENDPDSDVVLPGGAVAIDPTLKAVQKLEPLTTVKGLREAKNSDGQPLVKAGLSDEELEAAANTFAQLRTAVMTSNKGKMVGAATPAPTANEVQEWSAFDYYWGQMKGQAPILRELERGVKVVLEIGGKALAWIVDSACKAWKFLTKVFDKVVDGIKKVVDFLGFLFNWSDIKETRDSVRTVFESALKFGLDKAHGLAPKFESLMSNIEEQLLDALGCQLPPAMEEQTKRQQEKGLHNETSAAANSAAGYFDSVAGTKDEQPQRRRQPDASRQQQEPSFEISVTPNGVAFGAFDTAVGAAKDLWEDLLAPTLKGVFDGVKKTLDNLLKLFDGGKIPSFGEFMQVLGNGLITLLLGFIKNVGAGILRVTADLLTFLRDLLFAPIRIPGLSWILEKVGVKKFCMVDVVALLIAMPATVYCKIATGRKMPRITAVDWTSLVKGDASAAQKHALKEFALFAIMGANTYYGLLCGIKVLCAEVKEPKAITSFDFCLEASLLAFSAVAVLDERRGLDHIAWSLQALMLLTKCVAERQGKKKKAVDDVDLDADDAADKAKQLGILKKVAAVEVGIHSLAWALTLPASKERVEEAFESKHDKEDYILREITSAGKGITQVAKRAACAAGILVSEPNSKIVCLGIANGATIIGLFLDGCKGSAANRLDTHYSTCGGIQ